MNPTQFDVERDNIAHDLFVIVVLFDQFYDQVWSDDVERTLIVESVSEDVNTLRMLFSELRRGVIECQSLADITQLRATYDGVIRFYVRNLHQHTEALLDTSVHWIANVGCEIAVAAIAQRILRILESRLA